MKAIIIDDEQHCITTLTWALTQYCKDVQVVAAVNSAEEGIQVIMQHKPDVVFLDVEMPAMNGIQMLQRFDEISFDVIFTTAYDQYAIKAIKLNALDYLLKPVDKDELIMAVDKVRARKTHISRRQIDGMQELHKTRIPNKIALSTLTGLHFINLDELIRVEGEGNYSNFMLKGNRKILLSKKLGDAEEMLKGNDQFFRVHKSHIINLRFVERYIRGEGGEIIMEDGTSISLSKNKKEEFLKLFDKV